MWYSNAYRRHLCDMHIDDWDDSFLSEFSPEVYVENLKTAKIQNAMLYFQSHVGLCYYPTESGVMHKAFIGREDMMKRTEQLCHENGITVTGYYSLNYNTAEHDRHPSWRMVEKNGKSRRESGSVADSKSGLAFASKKLSRYGLCCPNNQEYREFVYRQIDEMLSYFDVEGMFFDMPFWPHTCYCENCRARWKREVGTDFPEQPSPDGSEQHMLRMRKKHEWMGEWVQSVTDHVKKINPAISVEHNFAQGVSANSNTGCATEVNEASDFVGGDLYGGILNHSLACKFYKNITKNAPFDYMFSRCKPALRSHTLTKSEDEMRTEVFATIAHHGATMVIDAIDPVGTLDRRVYERIGKVFDEAAAYEPYLHGKMLEDVGLYYAFKSRFGTTQYGYDSKGGSIGASKTLIGAHIPFGVTGGFHSLDEYRALIVSMISTQEADEDRILQYLENGGCVYLSGARDERLVSALTGGRMIGYTNENSVYVAPVEGNEELFGGFCAKYPLPFEIQAPKVADVQRGNVLATITLPYTNSAESRFASIHSDPPGPATEYPAVIEGSYGKGRFIWSALPIEALDMDEYREIFIGFLNRLLEAPAYSFVSTAESDIEITVFEDTDGFYVNVLHLDERTVMPTISPFEIGVRCGDDVRGVELLPSGKSVSFEKRGDYVYFKTEPMHVFSMYRILVEKKTD